MFSKAIALLLLAASAIAVPAAGTYRITNVASQSSVRAYNPGDQIYVSSTRENPGPYELWTFNPKDNGFAIQNVGLGTFAAVRQAIDGEPVITDRNPTTFNVESAGNGQYTIKLPNNDLLWNAEPPVVPRGDVALRRADGSDTEKWIITSAQD